MKARHLGGGLKHDGFQETIGTLWGNGARGRKGEL